VARDDDTMHVVRVLQPVSEPAQPRAIEAGRLGCVDPPTVFERQRRATDNRRLRLDGGAAPWRQGDQ
jgi:hypothetical protein